MLSPIDSFERPLTSGCQVNWDKTPGKSAAATSKETSASKSPKVVMENKPPHRMFEAEGGSTTLWSLATRAEELPKKPVAYSVNAHSKKIPAAMKRRRFMDFQRELRHRKVRFIVNK